MRLKRFGVFLSAKNWLTHHNMTTAGTTENASGAAAERIPDMSDEDKKVSGLGLLLLLAQSYYKILECVVGSPCRALDLDLNQSYLWTITTLRNLLNNNPELRDFTGKFEPIFPDVYPSTVRDSEWEDFVGPEAEKVLSDIQRYVFEKGGIEAVKGSPAWIFVEMFRPSVILSIERAEAYHKRMQEHVRRLLRKPPKAKNGAPPTPSPATGSGANAIPPRQNGELGLNRKDQRLTMAFNTAAFRIMIASPSDVTEERAIIREAIYDWNAQHSEEREIVLLPVGWETHAVPEFGDRPQALINKQVLKGADALVGVFWTRIGTHTGVEISGTVEEIREHLRLGKPAMLYFSSRPVNLDKVDAAQYEAVKGFRAECKKLGLIESYAELTEFRQKLDRHLTRLVISQLKAMPVSENGAVVPSLEESLSLESKTLLAEAVKDRDGVVVYSATHDGADIETNGKSFIPAGQPRKRAAFLAALKHLEQIGFLEDESNKGEIYMVTDAGFTAAEQLGFTIGGDDTL